VLSSISDPIEDNEYRIALKTGSGMVNEKMEKDYHFMRQDEDGNWSHKPGVCDIMYLDEGLTPVDISWDMYYSNGTIAAADFYTEGIIYFAIQYE